MYYYYKLCPTKYALQINTKSIYTTWEFLLHKSTPETMKCIYKVRWIEKSNGETEYWKSLRRQIESQVI